MKPGDSGDVYMINQDDNSAKVISGVESRNSERAFNCALRDLHRVPETKKKPDPTRPKPEIGSGSGLKMKFFRVRVEFVFENEIFSGSGRVSGLNFVFRVGFGLKISLFAAHL